MTKLQLNVFQAISHSLLISFFFVLSLYFIPKILNRVLPKKLSPTKEKKEIIHRFITVIIVTLISLFSLKIWVVEKNEEPSLISLLGFRSSSFFYAASLPLFMTICLFLGPLTMMIFDFQNYLFFSHKNFTFQTLIFWLKKPGNEYLPQTNIQIFRNLVMAPLFEELVFRSGIILLFKFAGIANWKVIVFSPWIFGSAHLHHLYQNVFVENLPFLQSLVSSLIQFGFTSIYGMFSAFLFVRTNHFIPLFLTHSFCNFVGFPQFELIPNHPNRNEILIMLILGAVLFFSLLFPLTDSYFYQ
ncbi:protease u48 caax prenyl protease rce1 [Anaeramoeba ignava]|uniref:intramembrane prenyl-peptidase Rce1 n=1 Tax=Anaeramoeba ignava TaxID=1746090 RepID=A0A9Q0RCU6_ANAIG|nr:protease u48 caax prenyl protease rce1 [Anaeramoeba ignava]